MGYPVTLVGGTDHLQIPGDPRTYRVGDVITDLPDAVRIGLQRGGIRFAAVHESAPPLAAPIAPPVAQDAPVPAVREGK